MKEEGSIADLATRCRSAVRKDVAHLLVEIMTTSDQEVEELQPLILSAECLTVFRCAALDRYVDAKQIHARGLIHKIYQDTEENEDFRTHAFRAYKWIRAQYPEPDQPQRVRGAVRTRGAAMGATRVRETEAVSSDDLLEQAKADPSPRIRWLASLGD